MKSQINKTVVANRIITPDGTLLWSRYTHDYVSYRDANGETYMTDGGPGLYCRRSVNEVPYTEASIYSDATWEVQRDVRLWGTAGMWIPVSKLSNDHINNILKEGYKNEAINLECDYRLRNHIVIPEHDYTKDAIKAITKNYKS